MLKLGKTIFFLGGTKLDLVLLVVECFNKVKQLKTINSKSIYRQFFITIPVVLISLSSKIYGKKEINMKNLEYFIIDKNNT
jgi:hypothetical protein